MLMSILKNSDLREPAYSELWFLPHTFLQLHLQLSSIQKSFTHYKRRANVAREPMKKLMVLSLPFSQEKPLSRKRWTPFSNQHVTRLLLSSYPRSIGCQLQKYSPKEQTEPPVPLSHHCQSPGTRCHLCGVVWRAKGLLCANPPL